MLQGATPQVYAAEELFVKKLLIVKLVAGLLRKITSLPVA